MAAEAKVWFAVGDTLVYPGYGVGQVQEIQERTMDGRTRVFCVLLVREADSESKVMIPMDNVQEVRLRRPSTPKEAEEALAYLSGIPAEIVPSWRERFSAHGEMLARGDLASIARVLKALYVLNSRKPLSFREKKMYQKALLLLSAEVGHALSRPRPQMEAEVLERLAGLGRA
jgi:CarD family transcriptional regulator